MWNIVQESEFYKALIKRLDSVKNVKSVTGPGRSGAIAAVYASHYLKIPFIPYNQPIPESLQPILIIDTAKLTGKTIRKAQKRYNSSDENTIAIYNEPPKVRFWYESRMD